MDVAQARRVERPSWINLRTVLGLALFSGAVLMGRNVLVQGPPVDVLWAAARDLPAGSTLAATDLVAVDVTTDGDTVGRYVTNGRDIAGAVLIRPVAEGELIAGDWLSEGSQAVRGRVMTIPVSPEHAVGGDLRPGDLLDVYATFNAGDARARTTLLARGVEVIEVVTAGGFAIEEESVVGLTVAVTPETAGRLAFAIRSGELDLVKVTGPDGLDAPSSVSHGDIP